MNYSILEAAKLLGVSRQIIYIWIKKNKISYEIKNGKKRISDEDINKLKMEYNYGNS